MDVADRDDPGIGRRGRGNCGEEAREGEGAPGARAARPAKLSTRPEHRAKSIDAGLLAPAGGRRRLLPASERGTSFALTSAQPFATWMTRTKALNPRWTGPDSRSR